MDNTNKIGAFLSVVSLLGFLAVIIFLCIGKINPENKDYFNMSLMALIGFVSTSFGFYLGTSLSGYKKDSTIASALQSAGDDK